MSHTVLLTKEANTPCVETGDDFSNTTIISVVGYLIQNIINPFTIGIFVLRQKRSLLLFKTD